MKSLLAIFILSMTSSNLSAQHHRDCPHRNNPERKAEVEAIKKLFANAKDLMVLEGLPHPYSEEELLKAELKRKDTNKPDLVGETFYTPAMKATNQEALRKALVGPNNISIHTPHKCGFHADYALRWNDRGTTYHAAFCFGCADLMVTHGDTTAYFSFSTKVMKPLFTIYDKKRPKPVKKE